MKKKEIEHRIVWQWLVRHPSRGYVVTKGYFMSQERCEAVLKPEYKVIKRVEATWKSIEVTELKKYENL